MSSEYNQVLVTGALGWLGSRLLEALVRGLRDHETLREPRKDLGIRCLILPGQDPSPLHQLSERIQIVVGDLQNKSDCEKFCEAAKGAVLFHTAGLIHPKRVSDLYAVNVGGTRNILTAAGHAGLRRAVVVSSNSPCGCNPHPDHLFDELSPYHPYLNYGRSKMLMEMAVNEAFQTGKIETVILRPPWFYGPNQPLRQTVFFRMIREGKAPIVGSGKNLRSMSYVDNLCQGLLLAASVPEAAGKTFWIADRRPYSMNEIVDTIERLLETEFSLKCARKRLRLPGFASRIAYRVDSALQAMGIYHQKIHVLSEMNKTIACSVGRAEEELGYCPTIELEEGMRRSLAWCVAKGIPL